jgi:hypothetical protein
MKASLFAISCCIYFSFFPLRANCQSDEQLAYVQREIATDALNKLNDIAGAINYKKIAIQTVYGEIQNINDKIATTNDLRRITMQELKLGYYCDQCWRTKTQIERELHIPFEQHLENVHGKMVPAPPEKMQEIDNNFANQLLDLHRRLNQKMAELAKLKQELADLNDQYSSLPNIWEAAVVQEDKYHIAIWKAQLERSEAIVENLNTKIQNIQYQRSQKSIKKPVNLLILKDYDNSLKDKKEERDLAEKDNQNLIYQQKRDKAGWIKLVITEQQQIKKDLDLIGDSHTFYIMSLAGATDYNLMYDLNSNNDIYQSNPQQLLAPTRAVPNNDANLKNYLDNLGKH